MKYVIQDLQLIQSRIPVICGRRGADPEVRGG